MFKVEIKISYAKDYMTCKYCDTMPQPMFTQLERLNWDDKIVRMFTTHEGLGLAGVVRDVKSICKGTGMLNNILAIY